MIMSLNKEKENLNQGIYKKNEHLHHLALILLQFLKKLLLERYFITERLRWCY